MSDSPATQRQYVLCGTFHITERRDLGSERIIRSYMFGIVLTMINGVNLGRRSAVSLKNDICSPDVDSGFVICVAYK